MSKVSKERIERILRGQETAIRAGGDARTLGVSERVVSKIEEATQKVIEKTIAPKWTGMSLAQQVGVARKMMRVAGVVNFRANFLKPSNFPSDIEDKNKADWTNDQIIAYYWGCPEFVAFWTVDLGVTEDNFRTLLPPSKQTTTEPGGADSANASVLIQATNSGGCKGAKPPALPSDTAKRSWYHRLLPAAFHNHK